MKNNIEKIIPPEINNPDIKCAPLEESTEENPNTVKK